jgi:hypothetical protein
MSKTVEAIRAEALFASTLQSSQRPAADEVRATVATTLLRLGISGCVDQVASEFGDHPETAMVRMAWALATVRRAYPDRHAYPGQEDLRPTYRPTDLPERRLTDLAA